MNVHQLRNVGWNGQPYKGCESKITCSFWRCGREGKYLKNSFHDVFSYILLR